MCNNKTPGPVKGAVMFYCEYWGKPGVNSTLTKMQVEEWRSTCMPVKCSSATTARHGTNHIPICEGH